MVILLPPFLALAGLAIASGFLWARRPDKTDAKVIKEFEPKNPLELRAAFVFAFLFLAMITATQLAVAYLGRAGINALAAIMGVSDVDPFILGITQTAGAGTALKLGAEAILIAAASNNFVKGIYAYAFADRKTGMASICLLVALGALGLAPLFWI
jgi:uncharacterized membrane protein (DUF4010 family)